LLAAPAIDIFIERWHPAKLNELMGGHWSKGHRLKKRDREMVWAYSQGEAKATGKRRVELTIILKPKQRAADPDAQWKSPLDALKHAGMIVDDNRQGVELMPVVYLRGTEMSWGTVIRLWNM
jgi:Holliday junction resolvase RusA-like endonuclease